MRERPILFSAPMVRAILAGEKTQTRRVMKHQPQRVVVPGVGPLLAIKQPRGQNRWLWPNARDEVIASCPYGKPGDQLWVRETWFREPHPSDLGLTYEDMPHTWAWACAKAGQYLFRADDGAEIAIDGRQWRPSIHMPRVASRIELEITSVRVEQVQAITEADAQAEGVGKDSDWWFDYLMPSTQCCTTARGSFQTLWESINGSYSWNKNPWVWVVEFKRVAANG